MKKLLWKANIFVILFCILLIFVPGCQNDWELELPNGYDIVKVNGKTIRFCEKDGANTWTIILGNYIYAECHDERYIGLQRIPADEFGNFEFEELDLSEAEYYVFDSEEKEMYGPFSTDEYSEKCEELKVGEMGEWNNFFGK